MFHISFCIFVGPLTCSRFKISIALRALSWKYFALIETKVAGKKFCRTFYEFKVYIFLLKVLLHLLIIFWKIRIDTLYEENDSRKIFPTGEFPSEKFPPINFPLENFPWKITTYKIHTFNIPTHFINCLSSLHTSFRRIFTGLLSNMNDNGNNNEKKFSKLRREYLKAWVGIFQVGFFDGGGGGGHQGRVWMVEIFRVRVFLIPKKIYANNYICKKVPPPYQFFLCNFCKLRN